MKLSLIKLSIFLAILLLTGIFLVMRSQKATKPEPNKSVNQPQQLAGQSQESEVHSGDGTMTLIGRAEAKPGQAQTYSFFVADIAGKDRSERLIFTKTIGPGEEIVIHHNSWSPDNKYVVLQVKDQSGNLNFLVFKASGETFTSDEQYLDVGAYFKEKIKDYLMENATGWASPTFFNVTTTTEDKSKKGPSYWFDVTARNFWGHR